MTNSPSHETQTDIENHALRAHPTKQSIMSKKLINEPVVTVTIYCKHWLRYFSACFLEKFMNPKTVLCFFAKIGIIIKHEGKESKTGAD